MHRARIWLYPAEVVMEILLALLVLSVIASVLAVAVGRAAGRADRAYELETGRVRGVDPSARTSVQTRTTAEKA